jgi:phosphoenolpyruvate-protein kinase (PTS system EI component)
VTSFAGTPGVPGLALGRLRRVNRPVPGEAGVDRSIAEMFDAVIADLDRLAGQLRAQGRAESADIIEANALIAADPDLRATAVDALTAGSAPDAAISAAVEHYAGVLAGLPDPTLADRAIDVRAVGRRLLAHLAPRDSIVDGPVVLVGKEVAADDLLAGTGPVVGVASMVGGAGAHTAIVARSLGVPVVFGVDPGLLDAPEGSEIVVDGTRGVVVLDPSPAERDAALAAEAAASSRREGLAAHRSRPATTRDGHRVALLANIASAADGRAAQESGAEGVGLVRTEMPFLAATRWPTLEEHLATLTPLLSGFAGAPVTVRTLDFADDKLPPFLRPAGGGRLGRGLPLLLAEPEAFAAQFRAILRAGTGVDLRIMIPMVAAAAELRACRTILAGAAAAEGVRVPPLGAMIELAEAVAGADAIAAEADFFSIGSNDLTAVLLGLSRRDPTLIPARAAEPVVLGAIVSTVEAARRAVRTVSVCGDAAAEPSVIPLLVGAGVAALSVPPAALDEVRAVIRDLDFAECRRLTQAALSNRPG